MGAYQQQLTRLFSAGGLVMQPVFAAARASRAQRVVYAEGEDIRVLRAAQFALEDGLAQPILIGRPAVLEARVEKAGLRLRLGRDVEVVNPDEDSRFRQYWTAYHKLMGRRGISPEAAKGVVNRSPTTIAALDGEAGRCGRDAAAASPVASMRISRTSTTSSASATANGVSRR